jgi:hypothetical protein
MQKGYIYEANGAWHVRFRLNGKQVSRKLADYNDQYRTKRSVRPLADELLDPLKSRPGGQRTDDPPTVRGGGVLPQYQDEKEPVHLKGATSVSTRNRFSRASVDPDSPRVRHSTH